MSLDFNIPTTFEDIESLQQWTWDNFKRVEEEFNFGRAVHWLQELHEAPNKLKTGMTVLADGTDWNPGSGAGVYTYYGGAWHKLG
jgi:hypothetical protein